MIVPSTGSVKNWQTFSLIEDYLDTSFWISDWASVASQSVHRPYRYSAFYFTQRRQDKIQKPQRNPLRLCETLAPLREIFSS
jgi:hypothetical protein